MNIFFTLDYELFLGLETGTLQNSIIIPLRHFTDMLDKYNVKTTIFVDAAYLLRIRQLKTNSPALENDYSLVCNNIAELSNQGHDIELHFHPQWIYSNYNDQKWDFDANHYKLSDLPMDVALNSFTESKKLLESISGKEIRAFRAGGFSLTTFNNYIQLFKDNNISIDSSVLRGEHIHSNLHSYDYRDVPNKTLYPFSSNINQEDQNGEFKELSISTVPLISLHYLLKKQIAKNIFDPIITWGDGCGIGYGNMANEAKQKVNKLFRKVNLAAGLDSYSSLLLPYTYNLFKNKIDNLNFVAIGHPKAFSEGSIKQVENFIIKVKDSNKFLTCSDIKLGKEYE